jgi:P-type conjugative transfer protein TrbG
MNRNTAIKVALLLVAAPTWMQIAPVSAKSASSAEVTAAPAKLLPDVAPPVIVAIPTPYPLPGQLKPLPHLRFRHVPADPASRIGAANAAARVQPVRDGFLNAIQQFPWAEGALYQIYAAPGQITDIALQEGEQLVGAGPVAAGDTVRWIIGDTISGSGAAERIHILVKPTRADLVTNLIINTDRRTYHMELRATPATYMASVSWTYPQDQLIALMGRQSAEARVRPIAAGIDISALNFHYRIDGDKPDWRPVRVFDDGAQVYIEFAAGIARSEMPPLFVIGQASAAELVNYRVQDRYMIVDRLFDVAELRLGDRKTTRQVRIRRDGGGHGKDMR